MARRYLPNQKKVEYVYPSRFGSHTSMIEEEETEALTDAEKVAWAEWMKDKNITCHGLVVLKDEFGTYKTDRSYLDGGMADPNRNEEKRICPKEKLS